MAISVFDARRQQDYMLQKIIAERAPDPLTARKMQQMLEHELKRRAVSMEEWQDNLGPVDLYKKVADRETKLKAEQLQQKIKAVQATLAAPHIQCTLSAAVNLWIVKFGDGWVRINDMPNEPQGVGEMNWNKLLTRLANAHRMEKYEDYVRIIT